DAGPGHAPPARSGRRGGTADVGRVRTAARSPCAPAPRADPRPADVGPARPRRRPVRPRDRHADRPAAAQGRARPPPSAPDPGRAWRRLPAGGAGAAGSGLMDSTPHLFDLVPDALVLVDGAGRIVRANANAERLFGYPAQGLDALDIEQLMPAAMRERHRGHRADYMREPRVRPMGGANMNLVGQRRDGRQFPVEIALSPLLSGDALCYLASVRDISESQRVRQALVRARYDAAAAAIGHLALASRDTSAVIERLPPMLAEVLQVPRVAAVILREGMATLGSAVGMAGGADGALPEWMQAADSPVLRALAQGCTVLMDEHADGSSKDGRGAR